MAIVATFPDAELLIAAGLRAELVATVATKVPNPRPSPLVVVRRVGGVRMNVVADEPLISVETWAADEADAHALAEQARAWLLSLAGTTLAGTAVYRVAEASGPQNLPDPLSDEPRYTLLMSVGLRGTEYSRGSTTTPLLTEAAAILLTEAGARLELEEV